MWRRIMANKSKEGESYLDQLLNSGMSTATQTNSALNKVKKKQTQTKKEEEPKNQGPAAEMEKQEPDVVVPEEENTSKEMDNDEFYGLLTALSGDDPNYKYDAETDTITNVDNVPRNTSSDDEDNENAGEQNQDQAQATDTSETQATDSSQFQDQSIDMALEENANEEMDPNKVMSPEEIQAAFAQMSGIDNDDPNREMTPEEIQAAFAAANTETVDSSESEENADEALNSDVGETQEVENVEGLDEMFSTLNNDNQESDENNQNEATNQDANEEAPGVEPEENPSTDSNIEPGETDSDAETEETDFGAESGEAGSDAENVESDVNTEEGGDYLGEVRLADMQEEAEDMDAIVNAFGPDMGEDPDKDDESSTDDIGAFVPEVHEIKEDNKSSDDSVNVDDIFQDALSAVAYSSDEDEALEKMIENGEVPTAMDISEDAIGLGDMDLEGFEEVGKEDKKDKKDKEKVSIFKRIFGNKITEETFAEEERERQEEEEAKLRKSADKETQKKMAAQAKEEKAKLAAEAKEKKRIEQAQKAEEKARIKAEKQKAKEEAEREAAREVVGKINPIGATIVFIFFLSIALVIILGSSMFNRKNSLAEAKNLYAAGDFTGAYGIISKIEIKEDDEKFYEMIRMCSQMQKELNSYNNFIQLNMNVEALDSLVKGVGFYDKYKDDANTYGSIGEMNSLESQVVAALYNDYGISETQVRELLKIKDRTEYTKAVTDLAARRKVSPTPAPEVAQGEQAGTDAQQAGAQATQAAPAATQAPQ